jgi:DNA replication and repair protein RecF
MILNYLKLQFFRNYNRCEVKFHPGINVLFGRNGQGKTNILESIYYLALTKSFRTNNDSNLILFKEKFFSIQAELENIHERSTKTSIGYSKSEGKRLVYNGQKIHKFSEYIGCIPIVLLAPSDLEITQNGPFKRRHFLDVMFSQASKLYLNDLIQYRRALRQRNVVLQTMPLNLNLLKSWEEALIQSGSNIINKRLESIQIFDEYVKNYYNELSGHTDSIKIIYQSSIPIKNRDNLRENYTALFAAERQKDIDYGTTSIGPHRDDLLLLINGKPLRSIGSQGEHKTFAIALKMAEFWFLENVQQKSPILLFDDIFGELDSGRILNMINSLAQKGQVFITTTSPHFFGKVKAWDSNSCFFEIENGTLTTLGNKWQKQDQLIN